MSESTGNNQHGTSDPEDFSAPFSPEECSPEERDRMMEIWELAGRSRPVSPDLTGQEVEQALSEVHRRISINKKKARNKKETHNEKETCNKNEIRRPAARHSKTRHPSEKIGRRRSSPQWRWWAAAAVILLLFGAGLLLTPHTVTAPRGEMVSVTLPDGSFVELNSGSQIEYSRFFAYTNRIIDLEGEAFFRVEQDNHPFVVNANQSAVRVTGTQFNVRSWNGELRNETEVTVAEGSVDFHPLNLPEQFVTVRGGELSRWAAEMDRPTAPEDVSIDKMLGWREGKLMFNEKPLMVILKELERRFDVKIQLHDTSMAAETLSAFYASPEKVEPVIKDICRVKGLRYAKTSNGYSVYK